MSMFRRSAFAFAAVLLPSALLADGFSPDKLSSLHRAAIHASYDVNVTPSPDHLTAKELYLLLEAVRVYDAKAKPRSTVSPDRLSQRDLQMIKQYYEAYPSARR